MEETPKRRVNAQGEHGIATIKVEWTDPDRVPLIYANIFMSQFTPNEFIVTIGQVVPPNTLEMGLEEINALTSIDGVTVVRLALMPAKMQEFIDTLQRNWDQYQALVSQLAEEKS